MDENKPSRFPAALFISVVAALLGTAAYREMQPKPAEATAVMVSPASTPGADGDPPSNEVADFPQLD
jgi:hypothetical protein